MKKEVLSYTISQLPEEERPRERLVKHGPEAISSAELIAIILGSGTKGHSVLQIAQELLIHFGSLQKFSEASLEELQRIKGLGKTKAIQLKAAINLGLRTSRQTFEQRFRITHPLHAYQYVRDELENEKRELIVVILQDSKGFALSSHVVAIGSLTQAVVSAKEVFRIAVRHNAASLILAHNHPSGDPAPSTEDLAMTQALIEAGRLIELPLNDHLVIGKGRYVSLRQDFKHLWNYEEKI
ncbi:MAG: DNA repair protein RadC [Parachlamydiaceae bacterium]|nr:MAG: DNA repair protein RadC [Parachlamydiaceae bacterium]